MTYLATTRLTTFFLSASTQLRFYPSHITPLFLIILSRKVGQESSGALVIAHHSTFLHSSINSASPVIVKLFRHQIPRHKGTQIFSRIEFLFSSLTLKPDPLYHKNFKYLRLHVISCQDYCSSTTWLHDLETPKTVNCQLKSSLSGHTKLCHM